MLAGAVLAVLLGPSTAAAQPALPPNFVNETVVDALDEPVSMAFLPDGRLLLTERRTARVRMVVGNHLAATDPVLLVPDVFSDAWGEAGLEGIAVDPRWPLFPYLYVCYTRTDARMALVRYTGSGDLDNPSGESLTFGSPLILIDDFRDDANHNGLGLRFGTDGRLLMTTGDDADHCSVQVPDALVGKLLRLDVSRLPSTGAGPVPRALLIPPDNPLSGPDSNARLVYAYGLRNPWRFHVDPSTGAILLADVGIDAYEELDEVFAGDNFGWPFREGTLVHSRPECGPVGGTFAPPILAMARSTGFVCISTAGVYRPRPSAAANWPPEYWGNLFYADFYGGVLRRLVRSGGSWTAAPPVAGQPNADDWAIEIRRGSDFAVGPDGSLYWFRMWDDFGNPASGTLSRIRYTGPAVVVGPDAFSAQGLSAAPNPFRGRVELFWRLALSAPVTIEIFDLAGRRVRRLHDDTGGLEGRTTWDGRDAHGGRAPPGLYLARLGGERGWERVRLLMLE